MITNLEALLGSLYPPDAKGWGLGMDSDSFSKFVLINVQDWGILLIVHVLFFFQDAASYY